MKTGILNAFPHNPHKYKTGWLWSVVHWRRRRRTSHEEHTVHVCESYLCISSLTQSVSRCAGVTAGLPFFCSRCVRTGQRIKHISIYSGCLRGIKHREKGFRKSDCMARKWIILVNTLPCSRQYLHKSASLPWIKWSSDSSFCHYLWQDVTVIPVTTAGLSVDIFCKENRDWASGQRSAKFLTVKTELESWILKHTEKKERETERIRLSC